MKVSAPDDFRTLVRQTVDERTQVRSNVAHGRPLQSEPDRTRSAAFLARRMAGAPTTGAEALQGKTVDYQSAAFLVKGAKVRRVVGYVEVNLPGSSRMGSGFLVSPRLFLTNCHVIGNEDEARSAVVTFDRELDPSLIPASNTSFRLDPASFFMCAPVDGLDFCLVAVGERVSGTATLDELGFCVLSPQGDKHAIGMNVNIVQHPNGYYKQVAIRNNLLTLRTDRSLLYETDTEVGSSGSPVFNDSWDVVALHHWGEPYLAKLDLQDAASIPAHVNEGVRISAIHGALTERLPTLTSTRQALLSHALAAYVAQPATAGGRTLSPPRLLRAAEAVRIDTHYSNRGGYKAQGFIPGAVVPLPVPGPALAEQVAPLRAGEAEAAGGELKYQHFSVKLNRVRRIAMFTATNIDGDTYKRIDRDTGRVVPAEEGETWYKDPRISESAYLGQDFYSSWSTYFDRGHLTRRTDPTWGSDGQAERANADTFHFTNCSPQHFRFNQSAKYWQGLERYVLENGVLAAGEDARLCVFQGPIFDDQIDLWADDVQIPSAFWKVVVWRGAQGLKAVGLVADQLQLMSEQRHYIGQPTALPSVDVSQWRVHISGIARRTGLKFADAIVAADTYAGPQPQPGAEAEAAVRLAGWADIQL